MSFSQRKQDVLNKEDKSSIGGWDTPIVSLCEKINSLDNYYTTSSCSGRIALVKDQTQREKGMFGFVSHELVNFEDFMLKVRELGENFKYKQEPPILHVACRTLEEAENLLKKAQLSGFKRSGVITLSGNIIVELISTEKMEFPLIKEGMMLVEGEFLRIVIQKSNENLEKGWKKIENLEKNIN